LFEHILILAIILALLGIGGKPEMKTANPGNGLAVLVHVWREARSVTK
jgi:hypothetical protein